MTETLIALDRASVRRSDEDNHLHVARTPISKANVCPYQGREIPKWQSLGLDSDEIYQLYRDPVELEKAAASFNGKPLLMGHKPVSAADHPHKMVAGGVNNVEWDAPLLYAALDIWDGEAIDEIESGRQEQLSAAYRYTAVMEPGTAPDGSHYDGRMTGISGNHVAIVPEGRAGPRHGRARRISHDLTGVDHNGRQDRAFSPGQDGRPRPRRLRQAEAR